MKADVGLQQDTKLLRSSVITGSGTLCSRIFGMVREVVFAAIFGDSAAADAFFVAFRIPNFLRRLFAEGAFSQAFVPVLAEYRNQHTKEEIRLFLAHVEGGLGLILALLTVVGVTAAPLLAAVFAPGYLDDGSKFSLLVDLLRVTFPYILLISLTGFAGAVLNSYGYFAVPALTPVLLNVVLIGAAVWISPMFNEPALALAWGVILAGLLQLMFQLPFLAHLKLFVCPRLNWSHPGVSKVIKLMLPVLFSVSIGQIGLLLDTILATSLEGDGAVSWLYYSDRLLELPLGIFGVAIATVILPTLSRQHSTGQAEVFDDTLNWGLRVLTILGLPAMAALLVLAEPLVITLYQRGQFGPDSVAPTVGSLRSFSLGLLAFMWVKVLASAYFSRKDTKTPVRYGVIALVSNMVLNLLLIFPLGHIGLALATAMSAWVNTGLLCYGLMREKVLHFNYSWLKFSIQCVTALVGMILLLCWQLDTVENWLAWDELQRVLQLAWLVVSGAVTYSVLLLLTGFRPKHLYP